MNFMPQKKSKTDQSVYAFVGKVVSQPKFQQSIYVVANSDADAIQIAKEKLAIDHYSPHIYALNTMDAVEKNALKKGFHIWEKFKVN